MATWLATLLVAAISLVGNVVVTAFYYGKLSQRVDTHETQITALDDSQKDQWTHINSSRESIAKIKGALGINGA